MIRGWVTTEREARLRLLIRAHDGSPKEVQFVIDTGFTGFLTLSSRMIVELDLLFLGHSRAALADGHIMFPPLYEAVVTWDGKERLVEVLDLEGADLVGMALLEGFNLNIPVVEGGVVTIEPLKKSGESL